MIRIFGLGPISAYLARELIEKGIEAKIFGILTDFPPVVVPEIAVKDFELEKYVLKGFRINGKHFFLIDTNEFAMDNLEKFIDLGGTVEGEDGKRKGIDVVEEPTGTYSVEVALVRGGPIKEVIGKDFAVFPAEREMDYYIWNPDAAEIPKFKERFAILKKWEIYFDARTGETMGLPAIGRANGFPWFNSMEVYTSLLDARLLVELITAKGKGGLRRYPHYFAPAI